MIQRAFFITGTDTGVGKTWATLTVMHKFQRLGCRVAAMKPVAAGCQFLQGRWKNEDALQLQEHASVELSYEQVNPYAFELPVSPHLAAQGAEIDGSFIDNVFMDMKQQADVVLVEGAGGWLSPLSDDLDNAGLAKVLGIPVILVVGLKLGCINHGLLTWQALRQSGCDCAGWIGVQLEQDMPFSEENVDYLQRRIAAPLLGVLPFNERADFEQLSYALEGF